MRPVNVLPGILTAVLSVTAAADSVLSQTASSASTDSGGTLWYFVFGVVLVIGAGAVFAIRMKMKESTAPVEARRRSPIVYEWKPEPGSEDDVFKSANGSNPAHAAKVKNNDLSASEAALHGIDIDEVREKLERIQFERLPISRLEKLSPPKPFDALQESTEPEVLDAVENSDVEYVADEETREAALEVLARHKASNSVEALSQMTLYDVSANLRSKAVMALAEMNHPSVFETVMLSCADPSREVRASGARAMFRLNFKRADSWLRMAECPDQYRISQVARAATEADFVGRSLERLVHCDVDYVYEALALITLLVKAGETEDIFDYLATGEDKNVRHAILRAFQIIGDVGVAPRLEEFVEAGVLEGDLAEDAKCLLSTLAPVAA